MSLPSVMMSSTPGHGVTDHFLTLSSELCVDGMPVFGMAGTNKVMVSELLLRTCFPFLFGGSLPVTSVILAGANQLDLESILRLPFNCGEVEFSEPKDLESAAQILQTMGISSSSLDVILPDSQSTMSQESRRSSLPFDPSDDDSATLAAAKKKTRIRKKSVRKAVEEPETVLTVKEMKRWCLQCNRTVKGGNLARHMWEQHKVGTKPVFKCNFCGREFARRRTLEVEHKCRMDPQLYPWMCDVCNMRFKTEQKTKNHKKRGACPRTTCLRCGLVISTPRFPQHQEHCTPLSPPHGYLQATTFRDLVVDVIGSAEGHGGVEEEQDEEVGGDIENNVVGEGGEVVGEGGEVVGEVGEGEVGEDGLNILGLTLEEAISNQTVTFIDIDIESEVVIE